MTQRRGRTGGNPYEVGQAGLPAWDRTSGRTADLEGMMGRYVALGAKPASRLLGVRVEYLRELQRAGLIGEGRIVERPYREQLPTYICVSSGYCSRMYFQPGEAVHSLRFGSPASWHAGFDQPDVEGRACVRLRRLIEGAEDEVSILTDRRCYRIRLINHPVKITICCSWTYDDAPPCDRPVARAGEKSKATLTSLERTRTTKFVVFELGKTALGLFGEWQVGLAPTRTPQLRQYAKLRSLVGICPEDPYPSGILEAVKMRLMSLGTISEAEARQWIELPQDGRKLVAELVALAKRHRRDRLPLPAGAAPGIDDMRDAFPFLDTLAETCFDAEDPYPAPLPRAFKIVWSMGAIAPAAALFSVIAPRFYNRPGLVTSTLRDLAELEKFARANALDVSFDTVESVDALVNQILSSALPPLVRHQRAYSLLFVLRTIRKYTKRRNLAAIGDIRVSHPSRGALENLGRLWQEVVKKARENRKRKVHRHAGRLADLELAADLNLEQVATTSSTLRAAETLLQDRDWIDVDVVLTIVTAGGRLLPGKQHCAWRIWNQAALLRALAKSSKVNDETERLGRCISEASETSLPPVYEYRGISGIAGSRPLEPFFVRFWRHGLGVRPKRLPAQTQQKRRSVLKELRLPGFSGGHRSGLLIGDDRQMDLWRIANRQHRTLAFLAPFEHALRYAHVGLSSTTENLSRTTAWSQQVQDQKGWAIKRLGGTDQIGFLAFDKGSHDGLVPCEMTWFPVLAEHFAQVLELITMTCERCGYDDGLLPEVMHLPSLQLKHDIGRPWVFSYDGSIIHPTILGRFLRFLLPGFGPLTFHDLRHLGANAALEDGAPGWMIRLALNQTSPDLWKYYAELSAQQAGRFAENRRLTRIKRLADHRASETPAA